MKPLNLLFGTSSWLSLGSGRVLFQSLHAVSTHRDSPKVPFTLASCRGGAWYVYHAESHLPLYRSLSKPRPDERAVLVIAVLHHAERTPRRLRRATQLFLVLS